MKKTIRFSVLFTMVLCLLASGCAAGNLPKVSSDTLYVKKVEGLPKDFIFGADISSVIAEEKSGVVFRNFNGEEADIFKTLAESGINYIRVRVWNDPYDSDGNGYGGGNNDIDTACEIGKRAAKYGLKLLVDLHYSDFWADPSKQMVPKAWKGLGVDEKAEELYKFTADCLEKLKKAGANIGMVQLGNETNGSMCGETKWVNILKLMISGSKAVREVCPRALIGVHFTNPEKADNMLDYAFRLDYYQLDYDVFCSSYYPYWHGTFDNLAEVLSEISEKYGKKVMVAETSYAFTAEDTDFWGNTVGRGSGDMDYPFTVAGQANFLRDLTDTLVNKTKNAIGLFYWEAAWITVGTESYEKNSTLWEKYGSGWASSFAKEYDPNDAGKYYGGSAVDNQALFDANGRPLESLKVFGLMRTGNDAEKYVDGALDISEIMMTDDKDYELPKEAYVVYSDNSKALAPVKWDGFDLSEARAKGNAKYSIEGKVEGYTVFCSLSVMEYNYVADYSFEENAGSWSLKINSGTLSESHKVQVTAENPLTGKNAWHFWTSDRGGVNFDISQKVTLKTQGRYKMSFSVLGGGAGTSSLDPETQNVYGFVAVDGVVKYTVPVTVTNYSDGYRSYLLEDIEYVDGQSVEIGLHVEISEQGCWGDIDDVMFNYVG